MNSIKSVDIRACKLIFPYAHMYSTLYDIQFAIPLTCLSFHGAIAIAAHKVWVYFQYYTHIYSLAFWPVSTVKRWFATVYMCANNEHLMHAITFTRTKWQYHFPTHIEWGQLWCCSNRQSTPSFHVLHLLMTCNTKANFV